MERQKKFEKYMEEWWFEAEILQVLVDHPEGLRHIEIRQKLSGPISNPDLSSHSELYKKFNAAIRKLFVWDNNVITENGRENGNRKYVIHQNITTS